MTARFREKEESPSLSAWTAVTRFLGTCCSITINVLNGRGCYDFVVFLISYDFVVECMYVLCDVLQYLNCKLEFLLRSFQEDFLYLAHRYCLKHH